MTNAIEVKNLTKYYGRPGAGPSARLRTGVLAVDHVNFEVHQGEVFGFLGPNGAGKTTTQRMLTTLLEPTEGRIVIHGHDLAHDAYPVKRRMGLVPEESNVYTALTAWDNLMFTARIYRVDRGEQAARARELLETFGLWEKRDVKVQDFSKGMRRRLSIAMAIIHKPALLFLDEPTPGLDAQSARAIRDLIRQLNAEGTTIFLTTHQIEEANQLCDRVAIIDHGQIAAIDTPEQLKQAFRRVQSVEVALEPDGQTHGEPLSALPGVTTSVKMGDKWRLYTQDPSALLPQVMDYARSHNLRVVSLSTLGPSLEDVFLEITGQQVGTVQHKAEENKPRSGDGRSAMKDGWLQRLRDELAQAWTVTVKDMKVYYLQPGMIMFGFMMPFFMFFSFSVKREMAAAQGVARLLALTTFFTAAAAGPFIIPLERRLGTYDRLMAAPMSLLTLLLGKTAVGALFAIGTSAFALLVGVVAFGASIAQPWLLAAGVILGSFSFSALGLIFGSIPTRNPGDVQMPSTLMRWGLLFISGVFVPLAEMGAVARALAYLSPLTYAQDLMNHAVLGMGLLDPWLDIGVLLVSGVLFLLPSVKMHQRSRRLGY